MAWNVGDWVIFDLSIGQIKKLDGVIAYFSDGWCETSGQLIDRFRPLTLANKRVVETFDIYYKRLNEIDGDAGFNYPDISQYFAHLALELIDGGDAKALYDKGNQFVADARTYKETIQGVRLFRPNLARKAR